MEKYSSLGFTPAFYQLSKMAPGNFIIHEQAREYTWEGECFLSLKSFSGGNAHYSVRQRSYRVNQESFLVLNECSRYRLVIDQPKPIESFCVFFSPEFVCQTVSALLSRGMQSLENCYSPSQGVRLMECLYPYSGRTSAVLSSAKAQSSKGMEGIQRDEIFQDLLETLIIENHQTLQLSGSLALKKKSVREEMLRRILYARDFIHSMFMENLTLKDIAAVSMLSENHLLRNFRSAFGMSPFQYITRLKIIQAKHLLSTTELPVNEIVHSLGYASTSNFSYYFRQCTGHSPSEWRKKGDLQAL